VIGHFDLTRQLAEDRLVVASLRCRKSFVHVVGSGDGIAVSAAVSFPTGVETANPAMPYWMQEDVCMAGVCGSPMCILFIRRV
jgi:hypothetical protein